MVGRTVAHYKVVEAIGAGGMGQVYRAYDTKLDREVALKTLTPSNPVTPLRRQRFLREARAVAALDHPNIVTVYSLETTRLDDGEELLFITMQLAPGRALSRLIARGGLSLRQFFEIAIPLADAVAAAHERGIIHRDLKPSNIMVDDQERPRILDFGLAKLREEEPESQSADPVSRPEEQPTQLTQERQVLGTVGYMSPEQLQGRLADQRSDIFSLGVILHEMGTGERPFQGESEASLIASIIRDQPTSVTDLRPSFPRHLGRIVKHALEKDPEHRFQSAKDLRNELLELRQEIDSGELDLYPEAVFPISRRWLRRILPAAAALLLLLFTGVYLFMPRPDDSPVRATPLTALPGAELDPAVSPNGDQVAFVWDGPDQGAFDLYVQLIGGVKPLQLTSDARDDRHPAWSPDGREIAFLRSSKTMSYDIMAVPALGGPERRLGTVAHVGFPGLAWSSDGRTLAVVNKSAPDESESIHLLDATTGEIRKLSQPPSGGLGDKNPRFSPDGRSLAFSRWFEAPFAEVWLVPISGGAPRRLLQYAGFIRGMDWRRGSDLVLATRSPKSSGLWRLSRQGALTQLLAAEDAWSLSVADQRTLIYSRRFSQSNIWRVPGPAASDQQAAEPQCLIASTRDDWAPRYSPDGTRIAFTSDRTGMPQLWTCTSRGDNCTRQATEGVAIMPRWSPDSRRLAFGVESEGNTDIYAAEATDGFFPRRLTSHEATEATSGWSPDGQWIYFFSDRTGDYQVWKVSVDGRQTQQVTRTGGVLAQESDYDGHVYYMKLTKPWSIWRMPADGGEEELVLEKVGLSRSGFTLWRNRLVYTLEVEGSGPVIESLNLDNGEVQVMAELGAATRLAKYGRLSVSPDGRWILYPQRDGAGSDLVMLENVPLAPG